MIKLGERVKDTITGFEGIVVCKANYLNGCVQIQVQSQELDDGKIVKPEWIDEPQLVVIKPSPLEAIERKNKVRPGGGFRNHP